MFPLGTMQFFLVILDIIGIIGGIIYLVMAYDESKYYKQAVICFVIAGLTVFGYMHTYENDEKYYKQVGTVYSRFGQVTAVSEGTLTMRSSDYSSRETSGRNTYRIASADVSRVHEGDIVRVTYVDGLYYDYLVRVQRFLPEKE